MGKKKTATPSGAVAKKAASKAKAAPKKSTTKKPDPKNLVKQSDVTKKQAEHFKIAELCEKPNKVLIF